MNLSTPITFQFSGKSYRAEPLGLADLVEHAKWVRDQHMAEVIGQMNGLPTEIAVAVWKHEKGIADKIQYGSKVYRTVAFDIPGYVYALFLALRKNIPDIELKTAYEVFFGDLVKHREHCLELLGYKTDPTTPTDPA
jgi:hypothetical protein